MNQMSFWTGFTQGIAMMAAVTFVIMIVLALAFGLPTVLDYLAYKLKRTARWLRQHSDYYGSKLARKWIDEIETSGDKV